LFGLNLLINQHSVFFITTIDVEADNVWADPTNLSVKNLAKLEDFQCLCNKYNIVPTYLLSYETLSDKPFTSFLRTLIKNGECEVGMHPHIWTIPPFIEEKNGIDMPVIRYYQSMLDEKILIQKLEKLHREIQNRTGISPTAHRAGRWGLCLRTVNWLEKKGYISDSSVVPYKSFRDSALDPKMYPDYFYASPYPYHMSSQNLLKKGNLELVEVPITNINRIIFPTMVKFADQLKTKRGGTRLKKMLKKLSMFPMELRPYPEYSSGTLSDIAEIAITKGLPIINLMFHSSELIAGGSPYSSDGKKTIQIWKHIEEMFFFVKRNNLTSLGISESVRRLQERKYFES
jgi:hypothetical protein